MQRRRVNGNKRPKKKIDPHDMLSKPIALAPPPMLQQQVRPWRIQFRVTTQAAQADIFTPTQLCQMLGAVALTTTTGVMLTNSVRFKRFSLWGAIATAGTPVSIQLKLADIPGSTGGMVSQPQTVGDTAISFDHPAYCTLKPRKNGYYSNWVQSNNASNCLTLTAPLGAILEIEFQFWLDDLGTLPASRALVGATPGTLYHLIATGSAGCTLTVVSPLNPL